MPPLFDKLLLLTRCLLFGAMSVNVVWLLADIETPPWGLPLFAASTLTLFLDRLLFPTDWRFNHDAED